MFTRRANFLDIPRNSRGKTLPSRYLLATFN
nr:MAG TPA: hypothetical protein [Caudoviricetes sp.]